MSAKDLIEKSLDAWNGRDRAAFLAGYSEDCELVTPVLSGKGHQAIGEFWDTNMSAFPDIRIRILTLVGDGDVVAEEAIAEGTQTGPMPAPDGSEIPATGRSFSQGFAAIHVTRGDVITSSRFYWDTMAMLGQLGVLPGA